MATTTKAANLSAGETEVRSLLSIRSVAKHFGKNIVLRDISLEIAEGEFLTILGESGSGKTTLLRILAGFEQETVARPCPGPPPWPGFRQGGNPGSNRRIAPR